MTDVEAFGEGMKDWERVVQLDKLTQRFMGLVDAIEPGATYTLVVDRGQARLIFTHEDGHQASQVIAIGDGPPIPSKSNPGWRPPRLERLRGAINVRSRSRLPSVIFMDRTPLEVEAPPSPALPADHAGAIDIEPPS